MAKITITIEDLPNDKVKVTADPNFETIMKMDLSGEKMTCAHGVAMFALNRIRQEFKKPGPIIRGIPRLGH